MATRIAPETPELVWFRGPDTIRFLNDLISQEIAKLEPGTVTRSLLLEPQGKLRHVLWVLRGEDEVGLITDPGRGDELASDLGRYKIRVDVEIEPHEDGAWLVVGEPRGEEGRWKHDDDGLVADISWPNLERWLITGERPDLPAMSEDDYETARIAAGEPKWGVDVDGSTIPHVSGLVPETVDFTKGCFLGQELVARIDSRGGNVPRNLRVLELGDAPGDTGTTVTAEGSEVGEITSRSGSFALATLKRGVEPGAVVMVGESVTKVRSVRDST
jgi:folate-binding protein YgfZ